MFVVHTGTPPDEENHLAFVSFYATQSPSPFFSEQEPTWQLGDKTREIDYLYHYVMSWIVRILPFSYETEVHILRLFSVGFGLATFVLLAKVWHRLGVSPLVSNVALLILTNLSMVLMMSSAVNNDTLVWLGVTAGVLLLLRLWQSPRLIDVILLLNLAVAGGLVKRTLLPIGLVFGILAVLLLWKHRHFFAERLRKGVGWKLLLAGGLLVLSTGLATERIGGNVLVYGDVAPECNEVQGEAACKNYWSNVRRNRLAAEVPPPSIPLPAFIGKWFVSSFSNITDIQTQGWRHEVTPPSWLAPLLMGVLGVGLGYGVLNDVRQFKRNQQSRWRLYVIALMAYIILVQLIVNYNLYLEYRFFGIALNGRYILPAVLVLVGLNGYYLGKLLKPKWSGMLAVSIIVLIVGYAGLMMMLRNPQLFVG